ncbi:hypothetical protein EVG20_g6811, partial [Dentipellis fragilis]
MRNHWQVHTPAAIWLFGFSLRRALLARPSTNAQTQSAAEAFPLDGNSRLLQIVSAGPRTCRCYSGYCTTITHMNQYDLGSTPRLRSDAVVNVRVPWRDSSHRAVQIGLVRLQRSAFNTSYCTWATAGVLNDSTVRTSESQYALTDHGIHDLIESTCTLYITANIMASSISDTTASPAPFSPFSTHSASSDLATSDGEPAARPACCADPIGDLPAESPDLGAFTTVFRALNELQPRTFPVPLSAAHAPATVTGTGTPPTASSNLSTAEYDSDTNRGSTVWTHQPIASYLALSSRGVPSSQSRASSPPPSSPPSSDTE